MGVGVRVRVKVGVGVRGGSWYLLLRVRVGVGVRGGHGTCSSDLHTVTPSEPAPSHGLTTAMKEPVMCSTSRSATRNCAGSVVRVSGQG